MIKGAQFRPEPVGEATHRVRGPRDIGKLTLNDDSGDINDYPIQMLQRSVVADTLRLMHNAARRNYRLLNSHFELGTEYTNFDS